MPCVLADQICAVCVTFNPDDAALACLRSQIEFTARLVIVDNGSNAPGLERIRGLASAKVTLLENRENLGVAAALNQGIRQAAALGFRWFLLFDQDTSLFSTSVGDMAKVLADATAELGPRLGLLGANYFHVFADGSVCPAEVNFRDGRTWETKDAVITSGTIIGLESFEVIGPFREDYFIDHLDIEYCLRARRKGFVVACSVAPLILHRLGMFCYRRTWTLRGFRERVNLCSPLRRYYFDRNLHFLAREYQRDFPESIASLRRTGRRRRRQALQYEGHFFRNLAAMYLAGRDGKSVPSWSPEPGRDAGCKRVNLQIPPA